MNKQLLILAVVSLLIAAPTFAADGQAQAMNEVTGTTNVTLSFSSGTSTSFNVGGGYSRTLLDLTQSLPLQGTAIGSFDTAGGVSFLTFVVGPTLNYAIDGTGINNALYLTAAGGIAYSHLSGFSLTNFAYHVEAGKRFELFKNIAWKPAFIMSGVTQVGANPQFRIVPVQISVLF